jgi:hypothetical protein
MASRRPLVAPAPPTVCYTQQQLYRRPRRCRRSRGVHTQESPRRWGGAGHFAHICLCHPAGQLLQCCAERWWPSIAYCAACRHAAAGQFEQKKPALPVADAGKDWTMADHPVSWDDQRHGGRRDGDCRLDSVARAVMSQYSRLAPLQGDTVSNFQ